MSDERACVNTDRELWRATPGDYYAPRVFVTPGGGIGIDVGGMVYVMPVRSWHALASAPSAPQGWQPIAEAQVRCERVAKGLELALSFPSRLLLDTAVRESIKELRALPSSPSAPQPTTTCEGGVTVRWCPRCGTCTCPALTGVETEWPEDPFCPIHGTRSTHEEPSAPQHGTICKVRAAGKTDPPQDCDWPFCGCDPHADKVIAHLQECGMLVAGDGDTTPYNCFDPAHVPAPSAAPPDTCDDLCMLPSPEEPR